MNTNFAIPKKTFLLIPAGTYRATIVGLEKAVGNFGEQVRLTFRVLTPDVEYTDGTVDLLAWCSANYSEKSKLFRWTRAALADEFDPEADFQAALLLNRKVMVTVERNASANGGEYNRIMDLMAAPKSRARATTVQAVPNSQQKVATPPEPPPPPEPPDDNIPW